MHVNITSIFAEIAPKLFAMRNLTEAKTYISDYVTERKINDKDKTMILRNVNECKHITKLQSYICNSLLQYEGLSTMRVK